ncbi:MAG: GNAT family N-acetyltransferase [Candidatus Dormibacter sp.]
MTFAIRPVAPSDLGAWINLSNACRYWQYSEESLLFEDRLRPPDLPALRLAAYTAEGTLVGTAEAALGEYGERWKDRAGGFVAVAPPYRRQGLGARLLQEVEGFATRVRVTWLEGETRAGDLAAASPLLSRRGFHELERYHASRQQPSMVDISGLDGLRDRLRREGIETGSFAGIDSTRTRESLYRCTMAVQRDMPHEPHVDWEDPALPTFVTLMFENPLGLRDGVFVARDGEAIVGVTYLVRRPGGDAEVGDTGVVRSHRRRGIGRALKLMATRYVAEQGFRYVYTDNRSDNAGMLAINRELGFVPDEVLVILEKTFDK